MDAKRMSNCVTVNCHAFRRPSVVCRRIADVTDLATISQSTKTANAAIIPGASLAPSGGDASSNPTAANMAATTATPATVIIVRGSNRNQRRVCLGDGGMDVYW
jgi:hypothetical protein